MTKQEQAVGDNLMTIAVQMPAGVDIYTRARATLHEVSEIGLLPEECTVGVLRALWYAHDGGTDLLLDEWWTCAVWRSIEQEIHEIHVNTVQRERGRDWSVPRHGGEPYCDD